MLCSLKNVLACSVFTVLASTFGRMSSDPSKVTHSGHSVQCWVCPFSLWRLWLDSRTARHWLSLLGRLILYLCSGFFTLTRLECERKVRQSNTGGWCWMFSHDYGLWLKNETQLNCLEFWAQYFLMENWKIRSIPNKWDRIHILIVSPSHRQSKWSRNDSRFLSFQTCKENSISLHK